VAARHVLRNKDFLAGLVFLAFGLAAIYIADNDYPIGTAMRMGSGYFPTLLGGILMLFGLYLAARGLGWPGKTPAPVVWDWRPVTCIVASMPLFEEHLRRAMLLARGDPSPFFTRPISLAFMLGTALVLAVMVAPALWRKRAA
jgi:hypothetical protein